MEAAKKEHSHDILDSAIDKNITNTANVIRDSIYIKKSSSAISVKKAKYDITSGKVNFFK